MIKRIIDKQTKLFIRDDFSYDEETEIGLDVEPAQGLYRPKWDGEQWVEDMTPEEIEALKAQATPSEPTLEERVDAHDAKIVGIEQVIDTIYGGV